MAKIGEKAMSNAIKRGVEEIQAVVTGRPEPEIVQAFVEAAKTRQWAREASVRTLA